MPISHDSRWERANKEQLGKRKRHMSVAGRFSSRFWKMNGAYKTSSWLHLGIYWAREAVSDALPKLNVEPEPRACSCLFDAYVFI